MKQYQELIGQKYGLLTIIDIDLNNKKRGLQVICQCECGNIKTFTLSNLKSGGTKSCGCLRRRQSATNLVGQRFGKLVVIEDSGLRRSNRGIIWTCQCDCGKKINVPGTYLLQGYTHSCGCLKQSYGELTIEKLLKDNNILYKKEYVFSDLFTPKGGQPRFDFAIFDTNNQLKYLIEYDGNTHDYSHVSGWNTPEKIQYQQQCDSIKTNYCIKKNIPLIRISYKSLDTLSIEDITL